MLQGMNCLTEMYSAIKADGESHRLFSPYAGKPYCHYSTSLCLTFFSCYSAAKFGSANTRQCTATGRSARQQRVDRKYQFIAIVIAVVIAIVIAI